MSSVIFGIRAHWMRVFCLPSFVVKDIDKLCRQFLWGDKEDKRKMHNIAWNSICRPRKIGGLGFRDGSPWNKVSMGNFLWAISSKQDSLWLKWIHCVYLKNSGFWTTDVKGGCSWYWRKLPKLRSCLNPSIINNSVVAGKFSSAKCYELLLGNITVLTGYKQIWCSLALPRHRIIFWMASQLKLLTEDKLFSIVSGQYQECHNHLFFNCSFSQQLIHKINCRLHALDIHRDLNNWMLWFPSLRLSCFKNIACVVILQAAGSTGIHVVNLLILAFHSYRA